MNLHNGRTRTAAITLIFVITATFATSAGAFDPEDIMWSIDTRLTWNEEALDVSPSIVQAADGSIWVVWSSDREHTYNDLYYNITSDYGANWLNYSLTSDHRFWDTNPSIIQARDGSIWVVWGRIKPAAATYDIYYSYSLDYGENWSPAKNITDPSTRDEDPSIMEDDYGRIWVAWVRRVDDNREIFYKHSSDHGISWSADTPLINHPGIDKAPSIIQAYDDSIWIAWASYRIGETVDFEIFYKYTYNYGETWFPDTPLTNQTGYDDGPCIMQARNGSIFVFWTSDRIKPSDSVNDLFFEISGDMGQTWSKPLGLRGTQLTTDAAQDVSPSAANIDDGRIWVAWSSNRVTQQHVEFEVFYKTSSVILTHDVAITSVTPSSNEVYTGETVHITIVVRNEGDFAESFNVTAKYDNNTIGKQTVPDLAPYTSTTLTFNWNTTDVAPSIGYTIKAEATTVPGEVDLDDNTYVNGTVQIKIPGDVDGNGIVNIIDALFVRKHIWHAPESCPLGLVEECTECDIDGNGIVDILDALIIRANYWQSNP